MTPRLLRCLAGMVFVAAAGAATADPYPGQWVAAEAGDARAAFAIAIHFDTGNPTNYPEALKWFQRSAEGGYAPGQAKLGLMYLYGWSTRPDAAAAAHWYAAAAAQGFVPAQAQVGRMAARGQGMQRDVISAYVWTGLAARGGDAQAAWYLPRIAKRMTPAELTAAESRIAAWRPLH